jgi:large conductance mechanosensitive channel
MGFFSDFKASLMKGDVLSLATAVVVVLHLVKL